MNIFVFLPELILFIGALSILMTDVFLAKKFSKNMPRILFLMATIFSLCSLIVTILINFDSFNSEFGGAFYSNPFTSLVKIVTLIILFFTIFLSADFVELEKKISSEFLALMMIATVGGMLLISSRNLLPIYMALELQALPLYLLAAIKKDSNKSSEAGVKYFILGSVASCILLFGISLIYGFTGSLDLQGLGQFYQANQGHIPVGLSLGFILVLIALFFKVSAAPFHMWAPDVYEGSATIVTTLFASLIKFNSIIILLILYYSFVGFWPDMRQIVIFIAVLSLIVGAFGAIKQNNIKRMLAYSAIGHIGFIFCGLAVADLSAIKAIITYSIIYSSLALGAFAFLLMLQNEDQNKNTDAKNDHIYQLSSIAGLVKTSPVIAIALSIIMFSMIGIPPLAGFFAKFYILQAVVQKGLYVLAVVAVLCSVVSAFYYLRIVKIIYFDKENVNQKNIGLLINNGSIVLILMALFNLLFLAYLSPLSKLIERVL